MKNKSKQRATRAKSRDTQTGKLLRVDSVYARASPIKLRQGEINLWIVGCGGTGSHMADAVAQLWIATNGMKRTSTPLKQIFLVDPDIVELKNVGRQRFCPADVGKHKALALAERYALTFGLRAIAIPEKFRAEMLEHGSQHILIGCVDNADARKTLNDTLNRFGYQPSVWWLNCGNWARSGEILLGSTNSLERVQKSFPARSGGICIDLPSPAWMEPAILQPLPEETRTGNLSCAEIALRNVQSVIINRCVAAHAADMLVQLLLGQLKRFSLYFSLDPGTSNARYVIRENVAAAIRVDVNELFGNQR
ncbi:thiamine biosynthesis protein ThiF [Anaerolineae bacterium CFX7]|nr:thiamine biosynthesis protein ThiF [Anaerolineae bacterium CFX7]